MGSEQQLASLEVSWASGFNQVGGFKGFRVKGIQRVQGLEPLALQTKTCKNVFQGAAGIVGNVLGAIISPLHSRFRFHFGVDSR